MDPSDCAYVVTVQNIQSKAINPAAGSAANALWGTTKTVLRGTRKKERNKK